jgi:hypothetical protein
VRKSLPLLLLLISFVTVSAQTDVNVGKNTFYLNPLPFYKNTFQVGYERKFGSAIGVLFSGGYTLVANNDDGKRGGNGEVQFRYYFVERNGKTNCSFYIAPYAKFNYMESTWWVENNQSDLIYKDIYVSAYNGGLLYGVKWMFKNRFTFDMYIGGGVQKSKINGEVLSPRKDVRYYGAITGFVPKFGFQFGYNF